MRIVSYNLFEGLAETYPRFLEFIDQQKPDILCLQEATNWQEANFSQPKDILAQSDYEAFIFGDSNSRHKLVTFTKPVANFSRSYSEGFWHSVIQTRVAYSGSELDVFNVHLDPRTEGFRLQEAKQILRLVDFKKPTLVTGDFNSLTHSDNYPPDLADMLQAHSITKFGKDKPQFAVTDLMRQAGLIDVAAELGQVETTVPSRFNHDKDHEVPLRLDYMFVTRSPSWRELQLPK